MSMPVEELKKLHQGVATAPPVYSSAPVTNVVQQAPNNVLPIASEPRVPSVVMPSDIRRQAPATTSEMGSQPPPPMPQIFSDPKGASFTPLDLQPTHQAGMISPARIPEAFIEGGGGARGAGMAINQIGRELVSPVFPMVGALADAAKYVGSGAANVGRGAANFAGGLLGINNPPPPQTVAPPPSAAAAQLAAPAAAAPAPAAATPAIVATPTNTPTASMDTADRNATVLATQGGGAATPAPTKPGAITRNGNSFSNVPDNSTLIAPNTSIMSAPNIVRNVPITGGGGGYTNQSFSASDLTSGGNGAIGPGAGVSSALNAAANRGDWDAVARHYQRGGGTFNGSTAAEDRIADLEKAAAMSNPGSVRQKSYIAQLAAATGRETSRAASQVASRTAGVAERTAGVAERAGEANIRQKDRQQEMDLDRQFADIKNEAAKVELERQRTAAASGKMGEETRTLKQTREMQQKVMERQQELLDFDHTKDPTGTIFAKKRDAFLTMQGKDAKRYIPVDVATGGPPDIHGNPAHIKSLFDVMTGRMVDNTSPQAMQPGNKVGDKAMHPGGYPVQWDGKYWRVTK